MIKSKLIRSLKSPYSENTITLFIQFEKYMIINDKHNGIIVLDLAWRELKKIYIGEQLLLIAGVYVDYFRKRIVFELEESLCFIDIDSDIVKFVNFPDNANNFYLGKLYRFEDDAILISGNENIFYWSFCDFEIKYIDTCLVDDDLFLYFLNESDGKEHYFYKNKLICCDDEYITILDGVKTIQVENSISIKYYDVIASDNYCLFMAEKQLQIIKLYGDKTSMILPFEAPWYGGRTTIIEKDAELHLFILLQNDRTAVTSLDEYVIYENDMGVTK